MSKLFVKIDYSKQSAVFYGPGTFFAKDEIKSLGEAYWRSDRKAWEVLSFTHSVESLKVTFPDLSVEELIYGSIDGGTMAVESPAPVAAPVLESSNIPQGNSVAEFSNRVKQVINAAFPDAIFVYGVLSKVTRASGRVYLELSDIADPGKRINCVIWSGEPKLCKQLHEAGFKLEADLQVMLQLRVDLNQKDARISCVVLAIVAEYTIAKLAALRETTNKRLIAEGIFAKNKGLQLPFMPMRLGVLTSASGTVINDFMASLAQGEFGYELFWLSVNVQGSNAKSSIVKGLEALAAHAELDAILLFRGGGSPAELSVFSDYEVAKAVCLCPLPVFSAIGHQEDQCSVQDVSYLSFGVPKDIGRFLADLVIDLRNRYSDAVQAVTESTKNLLLDKRQRVLDLSQSIVALSALIQKGRWDLLSQLRSAIPRLSAVYLARNSQRVGDITNPVLAFCKGNLRSKVQQLASLTGRAEQFCRQLYEKKLQTFEARGENLQRDLTRLQELSELRVVGFEDRLNEAKPEVQLRRGFSLITDKSGEFVTSREKLASGQNVNIEFYDGSAGAVIK